MGSTLHLEVQMNRSVSMHFFYSHYVHLMHFLYCDFHNFAEFLVQVLTLNPYHSHSGCYGKCMGQCEIRRNPIVKDNGM